jgi:hypothetical protein
MFSFRALPNQRHGGLARTPIEHNLEDEEKLWALGMAGVLRNSINVGCTGPRMRN